MPSRNQKKRSKQRAEYLQKREDILSQENKAKARERYKADPEKKKASVRDTYKASIVSKRAAKRQRYEEDLEENRAAKRQRYQEDLEKNRAAKRRIHKSNSAAINGAKRSRYWKGLRATTSNQRYVIACCMYHSKVTGYAVILAFKTCVRMHAAACMSFI